VKQSEHFHVFIHHGPV